MATTQTRRSKGAERRLSDDELERTLYLLKLCRYFDERMESLYRQGKLSGVLAYEEFVHAVARGRGEHERAQRTPHLVEVPGNVPSFDDGR